MKIPCLWVLVAGLTAGCASVGARPSVTPPARVLSSGDAAVPAVPQTGDASLSSYIQQVRELSQRARPAPDTAQVAERWSLSLAAAIANLSAAPTPANELRLAQAYVRMGILDQAYEHFTRASRLNPAEAAAWDGRARIWRDWGVPHLGLGDAYRAVWAAPRSAAVHNTLGTILQALGRGRDARVQFARALALDAGAAYAHNNLCYSWLMEANAEAAFPECDRALAIDPGLTPARNNLALAMAVNGDLAGAAEAFGAVGGEAAAQYNLGIVYLAQCRYAAAANAFDRAALLRPRLTLASDYARQARRLAGEAPGSEDDHERH